MGAGGWGGHGSVLENYDFPTECVRKCQSSVQLGIFIQMLSLRETLVICVAVSLLYSNMYMSFHEEVIFIFPRLESMGIAQFSNFPLKECM